MIDNLNEQPKNRKIETSLTVSEPITLEDLRWLVEMSSGFASNTRVVVKGSIEFGPMEYDPSSITILGLT